MKLPRVVRYKTVHSTNNVAKKLAEKHNTDWTIVVAENQTHGRGRYGRKWVSPKGGLWFSIILQPPLRMRPQLLQFLFANSIRSTLERIAKVQFRLKWPNDIIADKAKVAGILIETKSRGSDTAYAIIGVGINVNIDVTRLPRNSTSIQHLINRRVPLTNLLAELIYGLQQAYIRGSSEKAILSKWWNHCIHRNKQVQIETPDQIVQGENVAVNSRGIIIRTRDSSTLLESGRLTITN